MRSDPLKITKHSDFFGNDLTHFKAELKSDLNIYGFGSDANEELALIKSISELQERAVVSKLRETTDSNISSSGFAAHFSEDKARQFALFELIERDLFIYHWFKRKKPLWIDLSSYYISSNVKYILDRFNESGLDLRVALLGVRNDVVAAIVASVPNANSNWPYGVVFSGGASYELNKAVEKAIVAQRRIVTTIHDQFSIGNLEYFDKTDEAFNRPLDHMRYYLNPDNFHQVAWFLESSPNNLVMRFEDANVEFKTYVSPIELPQKVIIAQAISADVLDYFTGPTETQINSVLDKINLAPHPIG